MGVGAWFELRPYGWRRNKGSIDERQPGFTIHSMRLWMADALKCAWLVRIVACFFLLTGAWGAAHAAYDQNRGIAVVTTPGRYPTVESADRVSQPEAFRNLMAYQWLRAVGALAVGAVILRLIKRQDSLDPFSPGFGGQAMDDLERGLKTL